MGELVFVRHGQASYGTSDYDRLSPLGHQQAAWLGTHFAENNLTFDRILCGTLRRHRETLDNILAQCGAEKTGEDARLNEMSYHQMETAYGAMSGCEAPTEQGEAMAEHFRRVITAWEDGKIPQVAETYKQFRSRVLDALFEHARRNERVLIVSSGGPAGIAVSKVLNLDLHATTDMILHTHNSSYSRFLVAEDRLQLMQFNAIAHLERADRQHAHTYL